MEIWRYNKVAYNNSFKFNKIAIRENPLQEANNTVASFCDCIGRSGKNFLRHYSRNKSTDDETQ